MFYSLSREREFKFRTLEAGGTNEDLGRLVIGQLSQLPRADLLISFDI